MRHILNGRIRPYAKVHYARAPRDAAPEPRAVAPEPKFGRSGERMCDERSCVWPAKLTGPDGGHYCAPHWRLRFGRINPIPEDDLAHLPGTWSGDETEIEAAGMTVI